MKITEIINSIITSVGLGVTTSVIWAAIVFFYDCRRNYDVEKTIRKSIQPTGMSFSIDGSVGMEVRNDTLIPVTIRSVELKCGEHGNNTIGFGLSENSSPKGTKADDRGWVELPALTKATWSFPFKGDNPDWIAKFRPVKEIKITVEYTTLFGTTKIINVGPARNFKPSDFEHCLDGRHYEEMKLCRSEIADERRRSVGGFELPSNSRNEK